MRTPSLRDLVVAGVVVALVLAVALGPFASSSPDGLERVALDQGFDGTAHEHAVADGPFAEYGFRRLDGTLSGAIAAVVGIGVTFAIGAGLLAAVRRLTPQPERDRCGTS